MTMGRPTKYKPEFCDVAETAMKDGLSKTAAAGMIGICKATFTNWCNDHPDFLAAVKRGEPGRVLKLEQDLLSAETGPTVTSRIFALKNADPEEWQDRRDYNHRSPDGTMSPKGVDPTLVEALITKLID